MSKYSVGDVLMTLFMLVLFPVLIPVVFFVVIYWIACGLLSSDNYKKEVDE
jgi:hypothetical protein